MGKLTEKDIWAGVTKMLGDSTKRLGRHWSYNLWNDPKRLAFVMARYKFAAKMACKNKRVLELGCSEGIGAPILSEFAVKYTGVDMDGPAIVTACQNFTSDKSGFLEDDFLGKRYGLFDSIISLDVIEHVHGEFEHLFFDTIRANLDDDGICVVGTPNITSDLYASPASKIGHVNLFSADRLREAMGALFHNVFVFGMNDEVVHPGFTPMCHYLLAVGCYLKKGSNPA